jgi:thiol-disulfide isomerase/thioredoxin/uncharacterized membrane protein YphA (DoxX/SURF4 family)
MTLLIAALIARLVLTPVFAVAGFTKLADQDKTREMLAGFGAPQAHLRWMALALPLVELAVAVALIAPPLAYAGALAAAALLLLFTGIIVFNLARGRRPACNCFGQISATPIGPITLIRNGILTALALLALAAGPADAATWRLDEALAISPMQAVFGAGAALALALLLLIATAQLLILHRLTRAQISAVPGVAQSRPPGEASGLPVGATAPSFGLTDTQGGFVTLEQLLSPGRPVILLFTKPDCPPCVAMADEVDRWRKNYAGVLNIVRVSEGVASVEHYAVLQAKREVAEAYDCWGTPSAVLVMPDGTIGSLAAKGAAAIRALVKRAVLIDLKRSG